MNEKLVQCPICKSLEIKNKLICRDYTVSQESFAISECSSCTLKFTNPRPTPEEISKYYESPSYISHSNITKSFIDIIYKLVRSYTLHSKYKLISSFQPKTGRILDYGCGTGYFLNKMKKEGWEAYGVEPNDKARNFAIDNGLNVKTTLKEIDANLKYDCITLWHVLEHVHDPSELLQILKQKLTNTGMMYVAVPNEKSYDAEKYKEHWAAYDVPRHLFHFNQLAFKTLTKASKLRVHRIVPMKFDAFYVSMLSEKYKNGKNNYLEAVKVGISSNKWALKNNNNYSSLIYIIKK